MGKQIIARDLQVGSVFQRDGYRFEIEWDGGEFVGFKKTYRRKTTLAQMSKREFVRRFNMGPKAEKKIPEIDVSKP